MKEIPFRWIDKYLIHLKIQEKFYLLFILPALAVVIVTAILNFAANDLIHELVIKDLTAVQSLADAGNLTQQQVMGAIAQSDHIIVGRGPEAITVANGTLSLMPNPDISLVSWLSATQLSIIIGALFLVALTVYYIMTFIGGAMFSTNKALATLANGDLKARLNYFPVRDEFSTIAINIDKVSEREQKLVLAIQESVALMQQISSELNQSSQTSYNLSSQQQSNLDSLASATEEMATTIREVANLSHDSSMQTDEARNVAQDGLVKVGETLSSISNLSNEIQSAAQAVAELDTNAAQIDEVVATINAISEQTNLLALNAAIEAARAGEQGRGFAVVADEVRTLAGRTQQATVEIQSMIEALQKNSGALTRLMETTVLNANQGQSLMGEVDKQITDISDKNQFISESSTQIATAAEEQGVVADSIASSVETIRNQSNEVNTLIQSSNGNIDSLRVQSDQMEKLLTGLKA
ncbi:methyl-accepting chemotaxis protein [Vibrio tapetis subsp. quintayensis]|uniref:methyl-accepting chemotaxis protein n=1 Tax=Vibrio tapetis TaxID=52443 RepID=UPI0025B5663C|nr:methyl-accepting chemotaxis protein [Vibrio tapetis]MDN3679080.1 methyl-accepting chemotaxis protein [Vibrio tapetis subsp. quintayensis]